MSCGIVTLGELLIKIADATQRPHGTEMDRFWEVKKEVAQHVDMDMAQRG